MRINLRTISVLLLVTVVAGCEKPETAGIDRASKQELAELDKQLAERDREYEMQQMRDLDPNVIAASHTVEVSPAPLPEGPEGGLSVDSNPEDVCLLFLTSLQSGNREAARSLLTTTAQLATSRANLELDAPGEENSQFTVMPARYATSQKLVAEVDCLFHSSVNPDDSVKLTWMMRRQQHGWKISGMLFDSGQQELDLLSFENAVDLDRIQRAVSDQPEPVFEDPVPGSRGEDGDFSAEGNYSVRGGVSVPAVQPTTGDHPVPAFVPPGDDG